MSAQQRELRHLALPCMEDLYEATREVVHLAVLDGVEVFYFSKISVRRSASFPTRLGGRMPAHCTALGKAIVACSTKSVVSRILEAGLPGRTPNTISVTRIFVEQLSPVLALGYAVEHAEAVVGNACVAAPIMKAPGLPIAAISVGGPGRRVNPDRLGPAVRTAGLGLSREVAEGEVTIGRPARLSAGRSWSASDQVGLCSLGRAGRRGGHRRP